MVTVRIHHSVTETDFDDYHAWSCNLLTTAFDDERTVRRMAGGVIAKLEAAGVTCEIVESTSRTPFPREW